jgi:hypothetical protein
MASLKLSTDVEVAFGTATTPGVAAYTIDPTGVAGKVETWERVITFTSGGSAILTPKFAKVGVFASTTPTTGSVPIGGIYEVVLYEEGNGRDDGNGDVLDRRSFPCIQIEGRSNFLTKCTEIPQLDIKAGGTFASITFAASRMTMSRVQLGVKKPRNGSGSLPVLTDNELVAEAVSVAQGPKFMHRLTPTDRRLLPGTSVFFSILVWDNNGNWDYIWSPDASAPGKPPKSFPLLSRTVKVELIRLRYLDDSDELSDGEGDFTLIVRPGISGTTLLKKTLTLDSFESGTDLTISPAKTITVGAAPISNDTYPVSVQVKGHDDDTGSFPSDDDDFAETHLTEIDLPIGDGREQVIDRFLSLTSHKSGDDDTLAFIADLTYSVTYG